MSDNPLDEVANLITADGDAHTKRRIEREQESIAWARRVRRRLRWAIVVVSLAGIGLFYAGLRFEIGALAVVGFLCMLPVVPCAVALWMMGGMVPEFVRLWLSDREKAKVDD
jgi:hypothetical protein